MATPEPVRAHVLPLLVAAAETDRDGAEPGAQDLVGEESGQFDELPSSPTEPVPDTPESAVTDGLLVANLPQAPTSGPVAAVDVPGLPGPDSQERRRPAAASAVDAGPDDQDRRRTAAVPVFDVGLGAAAFTVPAATIVAAAGGVAVNVPTAPIGPPATPNQVEAPTGMPVAGVAVPGVADEDEPGERPDAAQHLAENDATWNDEVVRAEPPPGDDHVPVVRPGERDNDISGWDDDSDSWWLADEDLDPDHAEGLTNA
ncbi:hypothetical protein [Micromonospora sp. NPDC005367]|uniref:hypothetical protein n=1 Tax=Micromonospora sp. NPDC005367 TaxID=3155590 RepID=UPI0033A432F8